MGRKRFSVVGMAGSDNNCVTVVIVAVGAVVVAAAVVTAAAVAKARA